jgi:hypothetical protein
MADAPVSSGAVARSLRFALARSLRLGVIACVTLAVGCAAQHSKHERNTGLEEITDWLPGHYDNQAQIAEDRRSGRVPHEALTLSVVPVYAGEIGVHMFYLQEMTTGTREIKLQRLLSMGITNDMIVASLWSFTDPPRWREGDSTPELFTALQPPDVKLMHGCSLSWKKDGAEFTASNEAGKCDPTVSHEGVLQYLQMRVRLSADEFALSVREVDSRGNVLGASAADPYIRFHRSGGS